MAQPKPTVFTDADASAKRHSAKNSSPVISPQPLPQEYITSLEFKKFQDKHMESLLKDDNLADCKVRVGYGVYKTVFPVVKANLAKLSEFFRKRLYESDDKDEEIKFKFIPPNAFEVILRTAYHLEPKLDGKNVIQTLHVCKKLKMDELRKECERYLRKNIKAHNVLYIWDQAMKYKYCSKQKIDFRSPPREHNQELENHILHVIAYESEDVLYSEGFLEVSFEVIIRLVAAPFFRVKEEDLWQRTQEWMQCHAVPYLRRFRYKEKEQPYTSADEDYPEDRSEYETNLDRIRPYYTDPDHKDSGDEKDEEEEAKEEQPDEKPKLSVQSKDFEPTQKTIDELVELWDRWFVRVFRFGLMKPAFFLDRVKDRIEDRDLREEILVYFIDSKRRPKLSKIDMRDMTQESGFTAGCRVLKSNVEQENAKTLFDLTKGSRWSYRTCQQVPDQYFVTELPFYSYPQVIRLKNHFDDIDCVKELKMFSWKNTKVNFPNAKDEDEEWAECFTFVSQQTKEWQEFKTGLGIADTSRWFKIQVMSTYGRYSCIESIQFGIACAFAQVVMREAPTKKHAED